MGHADLEGQLAAFPPGLPRSGESPILFRRRYVLDRPANATEVPRHM